MKNSSEFVNTVIYNDLLKTARKVFKENKEKLEDQIEELQKTNEQLMDKIET